MDRPDPRSDSVLRQFLNTGQETKHVVDLEVHILQTSHSLPFWNAVLMTGLQWKHMVIHSERDRFLTAISPLLFCLKSHSSFNLISFRKKYSNESYKDTNTNYTFMYVDFTQLHTFMTNDKTIKNLYWWSLRVLLDYKLTT